MNILLPNSWLREYLKTQASPREIAKDLSLCSQSVENTQRKDDDYIYDIEITTNRPDCLSVYGIARELSAILPRFGIPAKLKPLSFINLPLPKVAKSLPLQVEIKNPSFCPRFTALIFDKVKLGPSPKVVQERLEKSGIRAIDNVVDISNYLMLELGQPMHTFDYDKIKGAKMILRESKQGEKIVTLDGQTRPLSPDTIIIEDGKGRIIDLCGIMGGENSAVDQQTQRVLLFIQTYDPTRIRRTCQQMAFRTEAAGRFEKSLDPEGVMIAMKKAIPMFKKNCGAQVANNLIDIYPHPQKQKKVSLTQEKLNQVLGVEVKTEEAKKILETLGFISIISLNPLTINSQVPHWRNDDINIPEDLIEEIARIYGYHNLPALLPPGQTTPGPSNSLFYWEDKAKDMLEHWGFTEVATYSMISQELLKTTGYEPEKYLEITNPLTLDLVYLRPSLIPSLLNVVKENQNVEKPIQIFELSNVYLPQGPNKLPEEKPTLTGMISGNRFYEAKGTLELLLKKLGIIKIDFKPYVKRNILFHPTRTAVVETQKAVLGIIGELNPQVLRDLGIEDEIVFFDLDLEILVKLATTNKTYQPISPFPPIIEDLSFIIPAKTQVGEIIQSIKSVSSIIESIELLDSYKDTRTFRIIYQHPHKTLTDKEVGKVREKIIELVSKKFGVKLKS